MNFEERHGQNNVSLSDSELGFPTIVCNRNNVVERQKIAEGKIGETLALLNKQIQFVHDNYATFAKVKYFGGDKSKYDKWIEIELTTMHKWDIPPTY